ncbi:DUF2637 domain-containing protein [Amycolatopsis oliviviridis]|uniref:DUF2637 domain-containing protein n=1 Tax=Amycolatopsis oliviviridis TaxID=1471590 RepID=A0ABQ3M731_9PSEU|nr:DUF2637 domain-containing protein [Amycolatopsis oliviviridis]GHH28563.1 hypothetical protein GCM10017790_59600 [Amycolatopsis oliviviridis]
MSNPNGATSSRLRRDPALAVQCGCTALVALGAAYASYRHGRDFALQFGADHTTAAIWPLIVDGLLMIATVELWKPTDHEHAGGRWAAWLAFVFGISLSLCANIGSTADLSIFGVTVAACPPLALLLAVELLNRALKRHRSAVTDKVNEPPAACAAGGDDAIQVLSAPSPEPAIEMNAEERMWTHYLAEQDQGRTPTGADLDRIAGTHNYGRRILRKWRDEGLLQNTIPQKT